MKKKSVLAIAIIAVVAVVASVSFAAWNAIVASKDIVEIDVADRVNIDLSYVGNTAIPENTKLAPKGEVISAEGVTVLDSIDLGTFTANFKNTAKSEVAVDSHKIMVTISDWNENLQYTLKPTSGTEIVLKTGATTADILVNVQYTISVSFIADAGRILEEDAAAVANKKLGAKLTFNAVKKTA